MHLSFLRFPLSVLQDSLTEPQISRSTPFNQIWHPHAHFAWPAKSSSRAFCSIEASETSFQIHTNIKNQHYALINISHCFLNNCSFTNPHLLKPTTFHSSYAPKVFFPQPVARNPYIVCITSTHTFGSYLSHLFHESLIINIPHIHIFTTYPILIFHTLSTHTFSVTLLTFIPRTLILPPLLSSRTS